ncbi:unnamed protein product (macronuclear) [Paramecium tetraurelia]|uniref:Transmembrane protein n=1 Tax=Paramecium tetraurelia TaxID=5888 RepID=A0D3R8_PARTE|nr:uncharacterized protein GSPATT00039238001 [Paramecium tetraurelia]CAK77685.1 unnamed protein product [Paramecium tetraurelia]|eukprot:XP_001445082.1 hypothetical protein (macronuclear) [Paramecium tetraurelia strain d4-2]
MNLLFSTNQTVIYQFDAKDNNIDNWTKQNGNFYFSSCGGIPYFYSSGNNINRLFLNLEPHSHIKVDAEIIIFENGQNSFFLDFIQENYQIEKSSNQNLICFSSSTQYVNSISISLSHKRKSFWIRISQFNVGLIKLSLSITCEYHCAECFVQYQGQCLSWKLHQHSLISKPSQQILMDGLITYMFIRVGIAGTANFNNFIELIMLQYSLQITIYQQGFITFLVISMQTIIMVKNLSRVSMEQQKYQQKIILMIYSNWRLDLLEVKVAQEILKYITVSQHQQQQFRMLFQAVQIKLMINVCFAKKVGFKMTHYRIVIQYVGMVSFKDQNNVMMQIKFSCPFFCQQCEFGKCLKCQSNYELIDNGCLEINNIYALEPLPELQYSISNLLDQGSYYQLLLQYQFADQQTQPIHISNQPLQTDDIFGYQFKRKTIENCLLSLFDQCLECQTFYKPSQNKNKCIPKCDDGIVIENEICDDLNNIQFDGCYKCQLSCQLECNECIQQQCYSCIDGWQLIDQKCYQICGDGLLAISSLEQCDDGNYQPYDGCYNCKFECNSYCFQCDSSNNCLLCVENFELIEQNQCKPICGDGIIIQALEECEDKNDIQFDGCYQCHFQCNQNCIKCVQGICQECTDGYDLIINECQKVLIDDSNESDDINIIKIQKCGDAYKTTFEQCDDGNRDNGDGCSNKCMIEENWNCNQDQPNSCLLQTKYSLKYENQTFEHQFVSLKFSNEVKLVSNINFTQSIQPKIINLNQNQYQITTNPVVDVNATYFTMALFEFEIVIFEQMSQPNFSISFHSSLIDNNNMPVDLHSQSLLLKTPKIINQNQINIANKFQNLGNILIIGLGAISILMLLFKQPLQCFEIFDLLQFQSYLKFVNISYPQNLQIYFQSSEIVTVSPILFSLKVTDLFNQLITSNFIPSIGKFQEYQTNADLLFNIQSQIFQIVFISLLYLFLYFYPRISHNYLFTFRTVYFTRKKNLQWLNQLVIKLYLINKNILNLRNIYSMKGFIQLYYANCWDLLFKVFLFMISNTETGYRSKISFGGDLNIKGTNENLKVSKLRFQQFESITLLKKLLFISILTAQQSSGIIQCVMLTLLSLGYIGLLLTIKQNIERNNLDGSSSHVLYINKFNLLF